MSSSMAAERRAGGETSRLSFVGKMGSVLRQHHERTRVYKSLYQNEQPVVAVYIPRWGYKLFWIGVFVLRVWCVAFLGITARLYWFMAHPYMSYYASLLGPAAVAQFKPIGVCFGLVALLHINQLAKMFYASICLNGLAFHVPALPPSKPSKRHLEHSNNTANSKDTHPSVVKNIRRTLWNGWARLYDRHGIFGVESEFFHVRFMARELVEIFSQTTQVYKASVLIARVWINQLYVTLIVINCWSTPIVQFFLRKHPATERLLCLAIDLVLDICAAIVIPLVIFWQYFEKFDFVNFNFELAYLYDDVWFANMVLENQQLFALSKLDFVWKIIPHLSIYSCLANVRALVREQRSSTIYCDAPALQSKRDGQRDEAPVIVPQMEELNPERPHRNNDAAAARSESRILSAANVQQKAHFVLTATNFLLVIYGICILTFHFMAARNSIRVDFPACKQPIRPWFATNYSCSVLQFNCHMLNTTGITNANLEILQDDSVVALVFAHCPALNMPSRIQHVQNLLGMDIFNCTLQSWNVDAAITNLKHPLLTYIIFVRVNMTAVPEGVLQTLPDTMTDFEISVSNITELPDDLHERWHPMALFYVEHTAISTFPPTLMHLQVDDLSLIGSQITELPEFPVSHPGFFTLAMTHTPLAHLPESLGDPSAVGFLNLGYTQLQSLPTWVWGLSRSAEKVYLHHTPFCAGKSEEERAMAYGDDAVLTCGTTGDRQDGKYPLAIMAPRRPYSAMF